MASHDSTSVTAQAARAVTDFSLQLATWNPDVSPTQLPTLAESENYCRRLALGHYENFPVVSLLLPQSLQQHFFNVYAWCRWADDLADEVQDCDESLRLLSWWRRLLDDCYAGRVLPSHPVYRSLQPTIQACSIPREPFDRLIDAFEQDQRVVRYESFEQLHGYCRGSADPVGRLVLYICGCFDEQNAAWSDSICTGLQLANFWQDVARDFDLGRVYLPAEDRQRCGYTDEQLEDRVTNDAFLNLMRMEVHRARQFLLNGLPLIERLPWRLQVDIELFARGGLRILERIESCGYRVWERRPVVTRTDLLRLLVGTATRTFRRRFGRRPSLVSKSSGTV